MQSYMSVHVSKILDMCMVYLTMRSFCQPTGLSSITLSLLDATFGTIWQHVAWHHITAMHFHKLSTDNNYIHFSCPTNV